MVHRANANEESRGEFFEKVTREFSTRQRTGTRITCLLSRTVRKKELSQKPFSDGDGSVCHWHKYRAAQPPLDPFSLLKQDSKGAHTQTTVHSPPEVLLGARDDACTPLTRRAPEHPFVQSGRRGDLQSCVDFSPQKKKNKKPQGKTSTVIVSAPPNYLPQSPTPPSSKAPAPHALSLPFI